MTFVPRTTPVQLAKHFSECNPKDIHFPLTVGTKWDGVFAFGLCTKGDNRIFSRTGKQYTSLSHLEDSLSVCRENLGFDAVLLFEVYQRSTGVNIISGNTRRQSVQYPEALGMVHDCIPLEDFEDGYSSVPYSQRLRWVQDAVGDEGENGGNFEHCRVIKIRTEEDLLKFAADSISRGQEGIIARSPDGPWEAGKRNADLMKIKQGLSFDLEVINVEGGKGKYKGTLGKLIVRFRKDGLIDGAPIRLPVSGMTDAQRHLWWTTPSLILGSIVKVDAMTYSANGSLREPRFKEVREDKLTPDL